jgi:serine/threonine protein kinase/Tfp pilus assembly protein PilF
MTPVRLQTIEEIFHAALDQEPDRVGAFLDAACEGDELLRRQVEALLASHERGGGSIETLVAGIATKIIQNGQPDLLVGQTIGHYKISKRIGAGGMGDVYLATDVTAGRKAALKLLPERFTGDAERLKRFQQEAHALVGLNHPNILTVYEIGEDHSTHYIASELIEGETLRQRLARGRMEVGEAIDVAIQVASALAAAHEAGVVHRDIKPENIMLRPDGYVKVLDFGIVKLAEQEVPVTIPTEEALLLVETNLGSILGTVRYMSPEQVCGARVDKGTDIWSLGAVLYETVTGHAPFMGDTPREVMTSILEKEPSPLTSYVAHTPAELQQIISETLRKDREERYQSAHELLEALQSLRRSMEFKAALERSTKAPLWLRWTRSPTALVLGLLVAAFAVAFPFYWHRNRTTISPPEKSIAVLPFENLSEDKANAYFAEGIQEEILTRLAKISDLKVISRTSTAKYRSAPDNLREIAKQLGVANILEGSVQKADDQVRVNVQLINPQTDSHLWADTYDRKLTDIFGVESEIAKGIADSLQAKLTGPEEQALAAKPTSNPEAYDAYLRGLAIGERPSSTAENTIASYEKAVQLDPSFALAWARLCRAHTFSFLYNDSSHNAAPSRDAAKRALENAQKLQPDSPDTLLALGYYQYWVLHDYELAKTTFKRVNKMLPGSSEAPAGRGVVARRQRRWDESIAYLEQALVLDPRNIKLLLGAADTYTYLRQFPAALKLYDRALDIAPNDPDLLVSKASIYQAEGKLQEAAKFLPEVNAQSPHVLFSAQLTQLVLNRNLAEAVRLLQARLAQFHFESESDKGVTQFSLAFYQRIAGDSAGAKVNAEQARDTLEPACKSQPKGNLIYPAVLAQTYAVLGNKDAALKEAERVIALMPSAKDAVWGPSWEENLAIVQTILGENSHAISILGRLLNTPYGGWAYYPFPITPAFLRLDPFWDPLRGDPAFQKLCEEKPR